MPKTLKQRHQPAGIITTLYKTYKGVVEELNGEFQMTTGSVSKIGKKVCTETILKFTNNNSR